jgi:hypothetical protein
MKSLRKNKRFKELTFLVNLHLLIFLLNVPKYNIIHGNRSFFYYGDFIEIFMILWWKPSNSSKILQFQCKIGLTAYILPLTAHMLLLTTHHSPLTTNILATICYVQRWLHHIFRCSWIHLVAILSKHVVSKSLSM